MVLLQKKDDLLPVTFIKYFKNYKDEEFIKVIFCRDLSGDVILREEIYSLTNEVDTIIKNIENIIENENWYKYQDFETNEKIFIFPIPSSSLMFENYDDKVRSCFYINPDTINDINEEYTDNKINSFEIYLKGNELELHNEYHLKIIEENIFTKNILQKIR